MAPLFASRAGVHDRVMRPAPFVAPRPVERAMQSAGTTMTELLVLGVTAVLYLACAGFAHVCDRI